MLGLELLALMLTEHNYSHWDMDCATWNETRMEILFDSNLSKDSREYLIDYLKTKVSEPCESFIIGRKSWLKERGQNPNYFGVNTMAQVTYRGVSYDTDTRKAAKTEKVQETYRGIKFTKELVSA